MIPEITKEVFERVLPVGISAHESLFEKVQQAILDMAEYVGISSLGDVGLKMLADENNVSLRNAWMKFVCMSGFLSVLRQLDLVLTPTGFGVVSSDKYAPASKMRVDALEEELRNASFQSYARLIFELRSPDWGVTAAAERCVTSVYSMMHFCCRSSNHPSYKEWDALWPDIEHADFVLRSKISDAQMDAILHAFRCKEDTYSSIYRQLRQFVDVLHEKGEHKAVVEVLPFIYRKLESDLDKYSAWAGSKEYEAYHHEAFKNTRDSSAYVFG